MRYDIDGPLLFVTASNADYKTINLVLLNLRDYVDYFGDDQFLLVESRLEVSTSKHTQAPVPAMTYDAWSGATVEEVEKFLVEQAQAECGDSERSTGGARRYIWYALVDTKGLESDTCIFGERMDSQDATERNALFWRTRMPLHQVLMVWANLKTGNHSFGDHAETDEDPDEEGCYYYPHQVYGNGGIRQPERAADIERFRKEGNI